MPYYYYDTKIKEEIVSKILIETGATDFHFNSKDFKYTQIRANGILMNIEYYEKKVQTEFKEIFDSLIKKNNSDNFEEIFLHYGSVFRSCFINTENGTVMSIRLLQIKNN